MGVKGHALRKAAVISCLQAHLLPSVPHPQGQGTGTVPGTAGGPARRCGAGPRRCPARTRSGRGGPEPCGAVEATRTPPREANPPWSVSLRPRPRPRSARRGPDPPDAGSPRPRRADARRLTPASPPFPLGTQGEDGRSGETRTRAADRPGRGAWGRTRRALRPPGTRRPPTPHPRASGPVWFRSAPPPRTAPEPPERGQTPSVVRTP